jgi:hypothetical protein
MKELELKQEMSVKDIAEHPKNKDYFSDISDSNPGFWLEFKDSITRFGIIEPLLVNRKTKYIRSGNQRYKAACELGLKTVPVILVDDDAADDEISMMIASNVYRRQLDPFKLFEYVAELRKGHQGNPHDPHPGASQKEIRDKVHKKKNFVSASDIWATLTDEQKEELKERFKGEFNMSEGELIKALRKIESEKIEAMEEYKIAKAAAADSERRAQATQAALERLQNEIEILKDAKEEIAIRDAQIRALEKQKASLKKKLREPDINKILSDCITSQRDVSTKLSDILKHKEALDPNKVKELGELIAATIATIRNNGVSVLQIGA